MALKFSLAQNGLTLGSSVLCPSASSTGADSTSAPWHLQMWRKIIIAQVADWSSSTIVETLFWKLYLKLCCEERVWRFNEGDIPWSFFLIKTQLLTRKGMKPVQSPSSNKKRYPRSSIDTRYEPIPADSVQYLLSILIVCIPTGRIFSPGELISTIVVVKYSI